MDMIPHHANPIEDKGRGKEGASFSMSIIETETSPARQFVMSFVLGVFFWFFF